MNPELAAVFDEIRKGVFGNPDDFEPIIASVTEHGDFYLVSDDFSSYLKSQDLVDEAFADQDKWIEKSIMNVAHMGFFSSDRAVEEYAKKIWNVEPVT